MTGWNLPPGCSTRHIEDAFGSEAPCDVCGLWCEECICPECPVCQTYGDPKCYEEHGMRRSKAQIDSLDEKTAEHLADLKAENRAYEQMWLDDQYFQCVLNADLANAIGWASRPVFC
jgi:hypothetical protein